jgi:hypothetical protein
VEEEDDVEQHIVSSVYSICVVQHGERPRSKHTRTEREIFVLDGAANNELGSMEQHHQDDNDDDDDDNNNNNNTNTSRAGDILSLSAWSLSR